ncbi:Uncharacterised protein [Escherichia coli]|nr:Uncharacterised protein [Escherichia coli]SVF36228.1 Uncharacterised protein [Escherichia coli]SVF39399.1 Uncharacterised protein [Escherichia coli]
MNTEKQLPSGIDYFAANKGARYKNCHATSFVFRFLLVNPHEKSGSCR